MPYPSWNSIPNASHNLHLNQRQKQLTRYQLVIFDFDGTLADSFPFFASVFNQLAQQYRFNPIELHEVENLRHASPRQIMQHVGMAGWKLPLVSRHFIRRMRQNAHQIELFAQVAESLQFLAAANVQLAIVSSNSQQNVAAILGPELMRLFGQVYCGMSIFGKTAHLKKMVKKSGLLPRQVIYIGDQETDAEAAAAAQIDFGAVSWGYGSLQALRRHRLAAEFVNVPDLCLLAATSISG
jgi:phosphoglycolate phosphatase